MAEKEFWSGTFGPFIYDDGTPLDPDNETGSAFAGSTPRPLNATGPARVGPPRVDSDAVRRLDLKNVHKIVEVADITNPTELNDLSSNAGASVIAFEQMAGDYNRVTIYSYDTDGPSVNSPYVVDAEGSSTERWVAVGGLYRAGTLNLRPGTTTEAPLKFKAGTNVSGAEAGAVEFDGDSLEFTPVAERRTINLADGAVTSSETIDNDNSETTIYTEPVAADELHAGILVRLWVAGYYDTASSSDSFTARLYVGGTQLGELASASKNVTDGHWDIEFNFTVRSTGASGTAFGSAKGNFDGDLAQCSCTTAKTIDTTSSANIEVTIQWNNAKTGNSMTLTQGITNFLN